MVRAWYMDNSDADQRLEHHKEPPEFLSLLDLYRITGVEYFKVSSHLMCNQNFFSRYLSAFFPLYYPSSAQLLYAVSIVFKYSCPDI